jgi:integrase
MGRPRKCWSLLVGEVGHGVVVFERRPNGPLHIRWWVPQVGETPGQWKWRGLKHNDREQATKTAREIAAQLMASTLAAAAGRATLADVLAVYHADVAKHTKGQGPKESERRAAIWTTFLGATRNVLTLDHPTIDRFVRDRRAGAIQPPDVTLPKDVGNTAIARDLEYLRAALNHACKVKRPDGALMLERNPIAGYPLPKTVRPRRPVATYDRFLAIMNHADDVDAQRLFGGFMTLVEGLGWRVSAICALRAKDVDLTAYPAAPFGRVYKNPATDKEGAGGWVPMSESVRQGVDRIRDANPSIGDWPLFPAPRAREEVQSPVGTALPPIPKSWTRHHARKLLERAEKLAKLDPIDGSDFHCYRRSWATARKHLPPQDVARAGDWLDLRSLQTAYTQSDEATVFAVMSEPTKLRDVRIATTSSA